MTTEFLQIGSIRRAHGLRGQVRVQLHDPLSEALSTLRQVLAGPEPGGLRPLAIEGVNDLGGGAYLVSFADVPDRTAAEALQGQCLYARRADLPPLEEDEIYVADLVGCAVVLPEGEPVGTVTEVESLAASDMLVVAREGRQEALIPLVPAIVLSVDLAERRIRIDPPEGLLDLDLKAAPQREGDSGAEGGRRGRRRAGTGGG